jgi:hypothetical protein
MSRLEMGLTNLIKHGRRLGYINTATLGSTEDNGRYSAAPQAKALEA